MLTEQELTDKGFHNRNHITGRMYLWEKNQLALNQWGFATTEWLTFLQCKQNGFKIKSWSKWIEVVYSEPIKKEEMDEQGKLTITSIPYIKTHVVFNLDQVEKVSSPAQQDWNNMYSGNQQSKYNFTKSADQNQQNVYSSQITQKQRLFLIKLIESKYQDERTRAGLLNRINTLSKSEAKSAIQKMLSEAN